MTKIPQVAIVGRTNVGKSRLFNRLTESQKAIVTNIAGTTRDSNQAYIEWRDKSFGLIDTGGWTVNKSDVMERAVRDRTEKTVKQADLVLLLVDGRQELTQEDQEFVRWLRKNKIPAILVANKIENINAQRQVPPEVGRLGFGEPNYVSAMNGRSSGDLLDVIVGQLAKKSSKKFEPPTGLKIAFVGKPNVGKSSLINGILNDQRVLVSPEPFTTRDALEIPFKWKDKDYILIDTAGLRRRTKILRSSLEYEGSRMSQLAISLAQVVILVLDLSENLSAQDREIVNQILEANKCVIIAANKWDLIPNKDAQSLRQYQLALISTFNFLNWAPIVFTSATNKTRVHDLLTQASFAWINYQRQIEQTDLNRLLKDIIQRHPPTRGKGTKYPRIRKLEQIGTAPPRFLITIGPKEDLNISYLSFVEKMLRERYDFVGCAIRTSIRKVKIN
ncbi:MAG: ribosome biogenesis GTPase Der [bacterium]